MTSRSDDQAIYCNLASQCADVTTGDVSVMNSTGASRFRCENRRGTQEFNLIIHKYTNICGRISICPRLLDVPQGSLMIESRFRRHRTTISRSAPIWRARRQQLSDFVNLSRLGSTSRSMYSLQSLRLI